MTVFGSNLMIMISAVLLVGFILRMINVYRLLKKGQGEQNNEKENAAN
jgi:hypothetical protein